MKTIFAAVAILGLLPSVVFARPPKFTEPLFQGRPDSVFVDWVAEKIGFPAILDAPAMTDGEPFWVHFKIDETGKIVDVGDPEEALSQLVFLVRSVVERSPDWTPGYDRKKPQTVGYNLFVRPAERAMRLLKVEDCEVVMPSFQGGGLEEFRAWVTGNLVYPESVLERNLGGRVVIKFFVERDGSMTIEEFPEVSWRELNLEVLRVLAKAPNWAPGSFEGIPTRVCFLLPINFESSRLKR